MKKILSILCMVLVVASCAKEDEQIVVASGEGAMRLSLAAGSEITAEDNAAIKIYKKAEITNEESGEVATEYQLVRRYTSADDVPDKLALLAGEYKATVTVGEKNIASFEDVYYYGETEFEITAGEVEPVVVDCKLQSTIVRVEYDESVGQKLSAGFTTTVAIAEEYDQTAINKGDIHSLKYTHATGAKDGYFMLPENQTSLVWKFVGNNPAENDGQGLEISKSGKIENVLANARYTIKLKYSKDAPGGMLVTATVESDPHQVDDNISFSPDPTIMGAGFDMAEVQSSVGEARTYNISALANINAIKLTADNVEFDVLNNTVAGITLTKTSTEADTAYTLTIDEAFFVNIPGGENAIKIYVEDVDGGKKEKDVKYNCQGVHTITTNDYDLWNTTATFTASVLNSSATNVKIAYRVAGTETWVELAATASGENTYTATSTDFTAGKTFEYKLLIDSADKGKLLSVTTPAGAQLPNAGLEIWNTINNIICPHAVGEPFWLTGNEGAKMANAVLTQSSTDVPAASTGQYSAYLKSQKAAVMGIGKFAAGNLFTGTFAMDGLDGKVGFGRDFKFTAKPKSLSFWMKNKEGTINENSGKPASGTDICSVMVIIANWENPHVVDTSDTSTFITKEKLATMDGVIAYGVYQSETSNPDWFENTINLTYREDTKNLKPTKVVVSFSPSGYGDYFCGSTESWMYVDDIKFNY